MNKLKEILKKSKYELCIFAVLSMNFFLFFTKDELMSDILYPLHLVDIKIGLISRTLVGSITGLLWKNPTKNNILYLHLFILVVTFFLISLFLGRCVKKAEEKSGKCLFIICLIVAVFPYGFMTFVNLFELLDIYWVLTIVLILLSAENKKTAFFIPILIFTGLWVHYSFLLAFMPVVYILCFNKCLKNKDKASYILCAVMLITSISASVYFITSIRTFNVISFEEFTDYLINKAGDKITHFERYIGLAFRPYEDLHKIEELRFIPENYPGVVKALLGNLAYTMIDTSLTAIIFDFILVSPAVVFFAVIWKKAMKTAQDKKEKFLYLLCLITPLVQLASCFLSSDTSRWLSLLVISQLFLLAIFIKDRADAVSKVLSSVCEVLLKHKAVLLFAFLIYSSIVFVW